MKIICNNRIICSDFVMDEPFEDLSDGERFATSVGYRYTCSHTLDSKDDELSDDDVAVEVKIPDFCAPCEEKIDEYERQHGEYADVSTTPPPASTDDSDEDEDDEDDENYESE